MLVLQMLLYVEFRYIQAFQLLIPTSEWESLVKTWVASYQPQALTASPIDVWVPAARRSRPSFTQTLS